MPICGYHPDMGAGLKLFAKGLSTAVLANAERNGRNLAQQQGHEQDELTIIVQHLDSRLAGNPDAEEVLAALAMRGIIDIARYMADGFENPAIEADLPKFIDAGADRLVSLLKRFEDAIEARRTLGLLERTKAAWKEVIGSC